MRETWTARDVVAGCFVCHGDVAHWTTKNAQALAARHHDKTGHRTWVQVVMMIRYGAQEDTR